VSDEQLHEFVESFQGECAQREGRCVAVIDLRCLEKLTVSQRKFMTDRMLRGEAEAAMQGCAMVFESRLLRGILTAMFWVHRPNYPTKVFSDPGAATSWAVGLVSRGAPVASMREGSYVSEVPTPSQAAERALQNMPEEGDWILQLDASRDRASARQMVEALRSSAPNAYLCERWVSADFSLWLGWVGPFEGRDEAMKAREEWVERGVVLTVSQWTLAGRN
jgi:hypothetical protein